MTPPLPPLERGDGYSLLWKLLVTFPLSREGRGGSSPSRLTVCIICIICPYFPSFFFIYRFGSILFKIEQFAQMEHLAAQDDTGTCFGDLTF